MSAWMTTYQFMEVLNLIDRKSNDMRFPDQFAKETQFPNNSILRSRLLTSLYISLSTASLRTLCVILFKSFTNIPRKGEICQILQYWQHCIKKIKPQPLLLYEAFPPPP